MEEATKLKKGAMAAVIGFDKDKLIEICRQTGAEVANFNSPDQTVITGEAEKVAKASEAIQAAGARRVIALDVSGAFHSRLMRPAVAKFEAELKKPRLKRRDFHRLATSTPNPRPIPKGSAAISPCRSPLGPVGGFDARHRRRGRDDVPRTRPRQRP